jgi:hypothetical protein
MLIRRMRLNSTQGFLLGIILILAGSLLLVFHRSIRERHDRLNQSTPWFFQLGPVNGPLFSVFVIVFAALIILSGILALLGR